MMGDPLNGVRPVGATVYRAGANFADVNYIKRRAAEGATPNAVSNELRLRVNVIEAFWPKSEAPVSVDQPTPTEAPPTPPTPTNRRSRRAKSE